LESLHQTAKKQGININRLRAVVMDDFDAIALLWLANSQ